MKRLFLRLAAFTLLLLTPLAATAQGWHPDILGDGYEMRHVDQGTDYSGKVISTIIRKLAPGAEHPRRAVLYVHGFNDYFFNDVMGDEFTAHGYDFYAVDLRKYGRSILPGQHLFEARSISEYFPDIDSALVAIQRTGIECIVLMGHSTGGLITACYMSEHPQAPVDALILNSPFLDWNLGWKEALIPLITWWGGIDPGMRIPQGSSTAYAESLLKSYHGYWNYNTGWKLPQSPDVTAGWVRAITLAQRSLRDGKADIRIPILLMYSSQSVSGDKWTEEHNHADGVLDVRDIQKYGRELGPHVTCMKVVGGLHDLFLSTPRLTAALYPRVFKWLNTRLPASATPPGQARKQLAEPHKAAPDAPTGHN